ncbi:MAG: hypothetical protein ACT4OK_11650 [Gemmobacter sp.]
MTVSYGTFSCTLEGFDDPFSTMKSIAEYFRDLAADDRYFGAEPPQPDPAMLHRIAEREVHRRVEARVQDNGVILRAEGAASPAPAPSYAPAYVPAAASPLSESVAAKLQRLRHAASAAPALMPMPEEAEILSEPAAPVAVAPVVAPEPPVVAEVPVAPAQPEAVAEPEADPAPQVAETRADVATAHQDDPVAEPAAEVAALDVPAEPVPEPVQDIAEEIAVTAAASLPDAADDVAPEAGDPERADPELAAAMADAWTEDAVEDAGEAADIPALMAEAVEDWGQPQDDAPEDDAQVDTDEDDLMQSLAAALADPVDTTPPAADSDGEPDFDEDALLAALVEEADISAAAAAEDIAMPDAEADEEADDAAFEAALLAATAADEPAQGAPDAAPMAEDDEPSVALPQDEALAAAAASNADSPAPAEEVAPDAPEADPVPAAAVASADDAPADEAATDDLPEPTVAPAKVQRARARVIKIRRAEPAPSPASTLTPEAEADLARELDAVKAEAPLRPQLPEVAAETSVQRLIDQTNSQLDGAESRRRLAAIEHLKAAVAATAADRRATGGAEDQGEATRLNAYRSDLERVVRPRRPAPSETREVTAVPLRPAPLVLVSAQRIDRPEPTAVPIRPRRIAASALAVSPEPQVDADADDADEDENMFSPAQGFAEFAERLGAQDLPDLLEAAVAYAACVEGRPHVSRPYMLRQVGTALPDAEGKRDEMLQDFGRLLRHGRIEKVRAGLYALPGSSRMMAEAKKVAG